jgi:hypothetical protein
MADDEIIIELPDDAKEQRDDAFFATLGTGNAEQFADSIRAAVAHATRAFRSDAATVPWRLCGARNIGGRVCALAQHPRNTQILYAGSAQGGVFKSVDGGDTWLPVGGPANALPIGALAIAPSDPNIVYIGTGELGTAHQAEGSPPSLKAAFRKFPGGVGLLRFDERVGTFPAPDVATGADSFYRIAVDPTNAERCWLATPTGLWRREAGAVYTREPVTTPLPVAPSFGAEVTDVVLSDNGDGSLRVLAAVAGFGIYRGRFTAASAASATRWERLSRGLPDPSSIGSASFDRITIAACASQSNHVYAVFETGDQDVRKRRIKAVYHSRDGGTTWKARTVGPDLGAQTWANLVLAVHPDNPALVIVGVVDLARSFDYGRSWHKILFFENFNAGDRAQHADQHAVLFDAANPHQLWVANDGGVSLATDIVQSNPLTDRTWRKRSDGLAIAQFNDITVHPQFPFIMGGGLQDNGTYVTFGGRTWYPVGLADGGEMAFGVGDPRTFVAPTDKHLLVSSVIFESAARGTVIRMPLNADQPPSLRVFTARFVADDKGIPADNAATFVSVVEQHPTDPTLLLVGRKGDAFVSPNVGKTYLPLHVGIPRLPGVPPDQQEAVSTLAYGSGSPPIDFWVGTTRGHIHRGVSTSPPAWTDVTPMNTASPPTPIYYERSPEGDIKISIVTRVAVHPSNPNYVVFSTSTFGTGRVFLSMDRGASWFEISGYAAPQLAGTPPPSPAGPLPSLLPLPPGPITSVAFDPSIAPAQPQVLYAGTLAGVYVIRELPAPTAVAVTPFHPLWRTFNGPVLSPPATPGLGQLPLTLVNNLEAVSLPHNDAAPAGSLEGVDRHLLIVAMFGRGIHACDITPPASASPPYPRGGPQHRLFIRQHLIEDGHNYPRPLISVLNAPPTAAAGFVQPELLGDPRFPTSRGPSGPLPTVRFTDLDAWDIRADHAPFQSFGEVLDGVEFDTELVPKPLVAGERNIVYVQVQTAGWGEASGVQVHVFFAEVPVGSPPDANPTPDLPPGFWATFRAMALSPPAVAGTWARVAPAATVTVHPNDPFVARLDWLVPREVGGKVVGLLAICEHPLLDAIPATLPEHLPTVIRQERRAAYRRVAVTRFTPDVYVRDSVEDDGTPGAVAFGGRSPDIIVVAARPADPAAAFADLLDARAGDRLSAGPATNFIYVRVHNRREVEIRARVELWFVKPAAPAVAPFDPANWQAATAVSPPAAGEVTVPARGTALVEFVWNAAPAPDVPAGVMPALGLIAFVQSVPDGLDPLPVVTRVRDVASFWQFFRALADSNNAAFRAVLYR